MKLEIAKKWVAALRSGDYAQTSRRLRNGDSFCCLGVLCDLYSKETRTGEWVTLDTAPMYEFKIGPGRGLSHRADGGLPYVVQEWAGVYLALPEVRTGHAPPLMFHILNDDQKFSFNEIADVIEANVENIV